MANKTWKMVRDGLTTAQRLIWATQSAHVLTLLGHWSEQSRGVHNLYRNMGRVLCVVASDNSLTGDNHSYHKVSDSLGMSPRISMSSADSDHLTQVIANKRLDRSLEIVQGS